MTVKERFISSIRFKKVDRIPTSYRGVHSLTISLMKYLNIDFGESPYDPEVRKVFLKKLGTDLWSDTVRPDAFNFYRPTYKGSFPEEPFVPDSEMYYSLGIKCKSARVERFSFEYNYITESPLQNISTISELKKISLAQKLDLFDFDTMVNSITGKQLNTSKEKDFISMGSLNSPFMICSYLRGMEQFLSDLALNKRFAEYLINMVGEFCLEFSKRELASFGEKAEFYCSWDDIAGQYGSMINPDIFKKYFLPLYEKLIENAKSYGLFFTWHICGSVHKLLPYMIDAGLDVFEVCQTSAKDMELEKVYDMYGKNVCIHGGIDVQELLVNKKPEDIEDEVRKIFDLWGFNGGIIIAPSHGILPGTPIENILAIYETANRENESRRS